MATRRNGVDDLIIKLRDRNVVHGASESDIENMLSELHRERHDERQEIYLSHAKACRDLAKQRHAVNQYVLLPSKPTKFPTFDEYHRGSSSLPSRGYLSTMVEKRWKVRFVHTFLPQFLTCLIFTTSHTCWS